MTINKEQIKPLVGKRVYVLTRQGEVVEGILDKIENDKIYLHSNEKSVE